MRVLQISKGLDIGNLHGGAERFAADLAISLKSKGIDVIFCYFFRTGSELENQWISLLTEKGITCFGATNWGGHRNIASYFSGIRTLTNHLQLQTVDVCHSHFQLGTVSSIILKRCRRTKVALRTSHVTKEWENGWYGYIGEHLFSRWFFPIFLDCEVGVSAEIADSLASTPASKIFHKKTVCIHNAIHPNDELHNQGRPTSLSDRDTKKVAIVGRLSEEKGHQYLFEAARLLNSLHEKIDIWVIGDGALRPDLENFVQQEGLSGSVHFFGQRADIPNLLSQVDLVAVPSSREGFPSIILESFQMGIPVIGTDVSGVRELIIPEKTGWLVPTGHPDIFAKALLTALSDTENREKFIQAGKRIADEHTIDHISGQYLELYRKLLKA